MKGSILVTGGAGYIGSHVVRQLCERGEEVVVLDNLSTGYRDAVVGGELIVGDTGDASLVRQLLADRNIRSILHFAANTVVPESVAHPAKYYKNNTANTLTLFQAAQEAGVEHVIFSSTAAVYGDVQTATVSETATAQPLNPYGSSKLVSEWILRDIAAASGLRFVALRYFNVAGAALDARIGQSTPHATHLIKVVCEALSGRRERVTVFGTDYPTPDGTGVRDYIHVDDLAMAHIMALEHLRAGGQSETLNCGYGRGFSVKEVIDTAQAVSGKSLSVVYGPRRPGDSAAVVADAGRIRELLGWTPRYDDLALIIRTALAWEEKRRY